MNRQPLLHTSRYSNSRVPGRMIKKIRAESGSEIFSNSESPVCFYRSYRSNSYSLCFITCHWRPKISISCSGKIQPTTMGCPWRGTQLRQIVDRSILHLVRSDINRRLGQVSIQRASRDRTDRGANLQHFTTRFCCFHFCWFYRSPIGCAVSSEKRQCVGSAVKNFRFTRTSSTPFLARNNANFDFCG